MCESHGHGPGPARGCCYGESFGSKKRRAIYAPWRRFVSRDENRKALEKYKEELEKELEAVNEKLEGL